MAIATSLQLDDEPQPVEGAATSLVLDDDAPLQSQGNVATSLERDDSASRLDDLTFVPGDTDQAYEQWKEWLETQEKQSFGMDDAIEIGKTMFGELYDGGKAFAANLAEGEFKRIVNSLGEGVLRGTADLGILSQKAKDRFTRDEALTRERFRGWREIRKLEAMREKARLGEEDIIDHLAFSEDPDAFFGYNQTGDVDVDPALAEGASYVADIGTVVGMPAAGLVRKGAGKKLAQLESKAFRGAGKLTAKGMQKTGDALRATGRAIKDKVVEITPDWAAELAERHKGKIATAAFVAAPIPTGGVKLAVEAADRIGPAGSALEKMVDDLPEMPTNMGPLERTSKDMNQTEGVRKAASYLNWKGIGDGVISLGKDVGRSAVYGAGTGAVLGGLAEGTEGAKSGAFAAGLTGGLGGVGGYALDTITGQRSAARMEGSINDLIKRHKGDQEAMAMLVDMANLEVVDKASGNLRNMARRALEDLATASEMLRGRVDIKVLPEEEFAKITKGRGVGGFYDPQTKEIILNADGARLSDTLLHEVGEAMWDSGMVDTKSVRNQVEREYDLVKLKRSYAEQMLKAEKRGQPTDTEITQRVNELDRQYANDGVEDWVVREMFSENFMAVSTEEGMHNYLRNNSKLSKLLLAVQKAARGFSQTPMTGLGMVMTEAKATVFSVVDKAKGGMGLDGLGHKKNVKEPGDTKKPEEPKNIFNEDIDPNSELSKSYLQYAKALNRQYKAYEQGKEKTTKLNKDSTDDGVNWDGVGKEYFDDVPDTPPSKGKGPQDSDSGSKGGGKKGTRKKAKNKKDLKKRARQRRKEVKQALEPELTESSVSEVTLKPKYDDAGNVKKGLNEYRGKFLQSKYSDAPMMENFRGTIDEVNQAIADGRPIRSYYFGIGTRSLGDDTWLNSLTRNSGDIPATEVDYIPHEWFITNKGNVNVRVIDLNYVRGRVNAWRDTKKLEPWNNDVDAFLEDAKKYLDNHRNNISGEEGLTTKQHNIINALFQANNKVINPLYTAWDKNSGNRIYKNLRIERIASLRDTSANGTPFGMGPFDHLKAKQMFSPTRAPEAPARQLDDLGMYSKAQEAIEGMQQKKGTSQQFLKAMDKAGVKKEELEDIGLDVFLKDNPTTTKEDVLNFIKANQIEMVEVTEVSNKPGFTIRDSEGGNLFDDTVYPTYEEAEMARNQQFDLVMRDEDDHQILPAAELPPETIESYRVPEGSFVITKVDEPDNLVFPFGPGLRGFTSEEAARDALGSMLSEEFENRFEIRDEDDPEGSATKFSQYTEPGAEPGTYTERLLTLPDPESKLQARYDELTEIFNRRNPTSEESAEYTELERRLATEEFDPRFGPYTSGHFDEANIIAHVRHNDRIGPDGEKILFLEEIQSDWHQEGRESGYTRPSFKTRNTRTGNFGPSFETRLEAERYAANVERLGQEVQVIEGSAGRTPNAPFKKSWPEFSMKRMLKLAADEGYDAIAWTTGETQNARYDLGNKVSALDVIEYEGGTYEVMARLPGEDVFKTVQTGITRDKLPDYIGKELTKRALDNMEPWALGARMASLEGDDLRLGGKGMTGFYDEMLPKLKLWKQTKDYKGRPLKVTTKTLQGGLKANYVALNEDINTKVSSQGVPRYSPARQVDDQGRPLGSQKSNDPRAVELDITSYDKDGKPVYQTVDYSILDSPFFQQWEGGPKGDVQEYDLDNVHYDVTQKAKRRIKELIDNGAIEGLSNLFVEEYNRLIQYPGVTDGMGWYSRMRESIKQVFGKGAEMFTHLLGATSAKTPVENNFIYAAELMKRYQKGDFKRQIKSYNEMYRLNKDKKLYETMVRRKIIARSEAAKMTPAAMIKRWIEHYNLTPVRANGKQYGQNSLPALKAMAEKWLVDKVTPKTPQFAMNLGGASLEATIDVWAARLMRRLTHEPFSEKWRIQPKSEGAVTNQDFAISQVVFREAARKLGMNPDDLQAIVWFGEKHVWDENGWTGNIGAFKSSFDEAFDVYFPSGRPARQLSHAENIISFLQKERLIKKHLAQGETDKLKGDIREYDKARKLTGVQAYIKQTGRRDVVKSIPPDVAADAGLGNRRSNRGSVPNDRGGAAARFSPVRQLNNRGGAIYRDGYGFRAVQTSSRAGVRIYSDKGRRVGPVFNSVEKAQDHLDKLRNN